MPSAVPIVALDVGSHADALALARRVAAHCRFFKVGSELFTAAGPAVVTALREELGADVFLDLKFHDIPATVAGAVRTAARLGVRLLTVHVSGGELMLRAAQQAWTDVRGAGGEGGVLGVTVLTSFDADGLAGAWGRTTVDVGEEVERLAVRAARAGLHGIVCSGNEAARVRASLGNAFAMLVPGIRLAGGAAHDQRRVVTPAQAQSAGARYLVIGRAVTGAAEPAEAMARVQRELGDAAQG